MSKTHRHFSRNLVVLASSAAALYAASALSLPAQAGTIEVKFTEPKRFSDIGRSHTDQEQTLATLRAHFESYAQALPANQTLSVEVTDVDLAGEQEFMRARSDLRVLRGRADWPRISMKYTLSEGGRTLKQGEEHLSDMAYQQHGLLSRVNDELPYERRMLDRWFDERLGARKLVAVK
jgi:hypothetical protein